MPALAQRFDVVVHLVQRAPVIAFLAAETVDDAGFAFGQVVFDAIVLAIAAPVADDPPFVVGLRFQQGRECVGRAIGADGLRPLLGNGERRPCIVTCGAGGQRMAAHVPLGRVGEASQHLVVDVEHRAQVAMAVIAVAHQRLGALQVAGAFITEVKALNLLNSAWVQVVVAQAHGVRVAGAQAHKR